MTDIRQFALFSQVSEADASLLDATTRTLHMEAGATVFDQGDRVRAIYLVRSGMVKIYRLSPAGQEQVLAVMGRGQVFAEAALFMKGYPASAQCIEDTELLAVERDALLRQLAHDPELALRMLAGMSTKLRQLVSMVDDLTLQDARGRICRYLLGLSADGEGNIRLPVTQTLLARLLGLTGETLSRTLKTLKDEGILETGGRRELRVLRREALEASVGEPGV